MIFFAGYEFNDIYQKFIVDLGTGTGRLSIASTYFNPIRVLSIDIDIDALLILKKNITKLQLEKVIFPICSDVKNFNFSKIFLPPNLSITTIMNPPFGVQKRKADRYFLEQAFSFSNVIYSIHLANENVQKFIFNFAQRFNWSIDYILPFNIILEKSFVFHTKRVKKIDVNVYRFIRKQS